MKKSLVIISFAFIFLLILSVVSVSAGIFRKTGNQINLAPPRETEKLSEGDTTAFEDGTEVTIDSINSADGTVEGQIMDSSGSTRSFALDEGQSLTLSDGSVFSITDTKKTFFGLGSQITTISLAPAVTGTVNLGREDAGGGTNGEEDTENTGEEDLNGEGEEFFDDTGFEGEFSCESGCNFLGEEEAAVFLGEGTFLNGHTVDLDEEGSLIVDGTYAYPPLEDGASYLVPIPTPDCHWEASFKDGELYIFTVCECALDEFAEEEFVE